MLTIARASSPSDFETVRTLFREYAASLPIDLRFQGFDRELATIETMYNAPHGCLLLATDGGTVAGCVGVRRIDETHCEMKRLFVRRPHRGTGAGAALARRSIGEARALGYAFIRLDTLPFMHAAIALYESLGFRRIDPYYDNPHQAVFMELAL